MEVCGQRFQVDLTSQPWFTPGCRAHSRHRVWGCAFHGTTTGVVSVALHASGTSLRAQRYTAVRVGRGTVDESPAPNAQAVYVDAQRFTRYYSWLWLCQLRPRGQRADSLCCWHQTAADAARIQSINRRMLRQQQKQKPRCPVLLTQRAVPPPALQWSLVGGALLHRASAGPILRSCSMVVQAPFHGPSTYRTELRVQCLELCCTLALDASQSCSSLRFDLLRLRSYTSHLFLFAQCLVVQLLKRLAGCLNSNLQLLRIVRLPTV